MTDADGAAPTQRCPACATHKTQEHYPPSGWGRSGTYCRPCRTIKARGWKANPNRKVMHPLPAAELIRLRHLVSCLVCHAVPRMIGVDEKGHDVVRTEHDTSCPAAEKRMRKTG